jgi:hypothetical protein
MPTATVWSQITANHVQMVKGIAKEGKTVLRAQMVKKGEIMMRAKRASAIRMYVNEFIVPSIWEL